MALARNYFSHKPVTLATYAVAQSIIREITENFIEHKLKFKTVSLMSESVGLVGYTDDGAEVQITICRNTRKGYDVHTIKYYRFSDKIDKLEGVRLTLDQLKKTLLEHKLQMGIIRVLETE